MNRYARESLLAQKGRQQKRNILTSQDSGDQERGLVLRKLSFTICQASSTILSLLTAFDTSVVYTSSTSFSGQFTELEDSSTEGDSKAKMELGAETRSPKDRTNEIPVDRAC